MAGNAVTPSIRVQDTASALRFYRETLGFELVRGDEGGGNYSLRRGGASLMIEGAADFYSAGYNSAIRQRLGSRSANALYIEADDVESLYADVQAKGVQPIDPLGPRDWGQSEFTVEDPEGNWLTFWKMTQPN